MERFSRDMVSTIISNPHSASTSAQSTARRIDDLRVRLLRMFAADPDHFDLVFVANATAGMKLVADALRDHENGFWFGYHRDSHTSLVGVRELSRSHRCFETDEEFASWTASAESYASVDGTVKLLAYPAQSNMNGRRLPLNWCHQIKLAAKGKGFPAYTLLDAAALVSTSPLDLSEVELAPDFVVLSLYKIFGFPDLGCLIVKKDAEDAFDRRRYFGGGTVDMVVCVKEDWHVRKTDSLHDRLEDGTLPFHSILALESALGVHKELFGSLERISRHTANLARRLADGLSALRHYNGAKVCEMYSDPSGFLDTRFQGPVIALNIRNSRGGWSFNSEVEKLAAVRNIEFRTGGLCNPGGVASSLHLAPWEMKENFSAGLRCGSENDVMSGKPTGVIRLSLGAMSNTRDVDSFLEFMQEFFVDKSSLKKSPVAPPLDQVQPPTKTNFYVESLTIYPIKSCAGWNVGSREWEIRKEGLAWDREWCLVHVGTNKALSQKRYPRMALLRPSIDLDNGLLKVRVAGSAGLSAAAPEIAVPLSADPRYFGDINTSRSASTKVCGDTVSAKVYSSAQISGFFSDALGVACRLARFPPLGATNPSSRHAKAHLQRPLGPGVMHVPGAFLDSPQLAPPKSGPRILLSNESPILVVSRSSLNNLNNRIKEGGGKAARVEAFRANIVVAEISADECRPERPYVEDKWRRVKMGRETFEVLGSCRRCQMVCVDQDTAERNEEPFVSLAKTRRFDGKVFFGQHTVLVQTEDASSPRAQRATLSAGDPVVAYEE